MPDHLEIPAAAARCAPPSPRGIAGDHDRHGVADAHLQLVGQHAAENDPVHSRLKIARACPRAWHRAMVDTSALERRDRCRARWRRSSTDGWLSMASVSRNGAAPIRPGDPCSWPHAVPPVGDRRPARASSVACADRLSKRVAQLGFEAVHDRKHGDQGRPRPAATPSSDTQVMKDTKKLCSRASEYRRPTKTGRG